MSFLSAQPPLSDVQVALAALAQLHDAQAIAPFAHSHNGYIREAAITRCVELNTPEMLPIVVSRLNDWVLQVRDAAREAVMALAPVCSSSGLLGALPHILHLQDARRTEHTAWIATYQALLTTRLSAADIRTGIASADSAVSRAAFQLARIAKLFSHEELIGLALARRDDILLAQGALGLIGELPAALRQPWFEQLISAHFLLLRLAALRALLAHDAPGATARAVAVLQDRSAGMREVAIGYLRQAGFDVRDYYRRLLLAASTPASLASIALTALGSLREQDDIPLVVSFDRADTPAVRAAALSAWLRLAPGSKDDIALLALRDTTPRLRRMAWDIVRRHHAYIPFDQVHAILMPLRDYRRMLQFAQTSQWQWLETLLEITAACAGDPATMDVLQQSARHWRRRAGRCYTAPEPRLATLFSLPASQHALAVLDIPAQWLHPI